MSTPNRPRHPGRYIDRLTGELAEEKKGKRIKQEPVRLLSSGSGYVQDSKYALGHDAQHATPFVNLLGEDENATPPEPAAVDKETQTWITETSHQQFAALRRREVRKRQHQTLQGHLRAVCSEAARRDIDPAELEQIQQLLDSLRQRLKKAA